MIKKDYIQRYIDELAKMLAVVINLKENNEPDKAETLLNDFITDYLGTNFDEILAINEKNIINYLLNEKKYNITHFKLLENVLYHKYLFNTDNQKFKNLTLEVLNYLIKTDTDFSVERKNRIDELTVLPSNRKR